MSVCLQSQYFEKPAVLAAVITSSFELSFSYVEVSEWLACCFFEDKICSIFPPRLSSERNFCHRYDSNPPTTSDSDSDSDYSDDSAGEEEGSDADERRKAREEKKKEKEQRKIEKEEKKKEKAKTAKTVVSYF